MATLGQLHRFAWRSTQRVQRLNTPSPTGRNGSQNWSKNKKKNNPVLAKFELKSELLMQAAATFTEKTGAGNKSTHERFSRQLLPSFLPAIQLGSLKMASARLRAALHLFFPGADHLLSKYHAPLVTEISWGRRDYYTAQPLALSQTKSIWSLYDLGKVSSCLPSFAGQVL